ncbi:transcription termination/antitermination NusG family protein [Aeoliella mucimassa]|uniref:transcription termination/antitermination NusG family protein n=1 Tax=Aeoliella mucimassa TaxID=2527972 RepID=UPI0011A2B345|nr:transcription termination/antitermination NusG family protein [Aeoliella mucimassa]
MVAHELQAGDVEEALSETDRAQREYSELRTTRNPYLYPAGLLDSEYRRAIFQEYAHETSAEDSQRTWWLLHAKPRQEKRLADELRRLDVPHYLPATKSKAITRGKPRYSWMPLFSGYLFLWSNEAQRLSALQTNRIVHSYPGPC